MPYSTPNSPTLVIPLQRPTHRRSYAHHQHHAQSPTFSNEKGVGTFASLGSLPRRRGGSSKFRIPSESSDEESDHLPKVALRSKPPSFKLDAPKLQSPTHGTPAVSTAPVPFPTTRSPSLSPAVEDHLRPPQDKLQRASSSSMIYLSNGKPLKSSLKSSSSTGSVAGLSADIRHSRAKSAPSTPGPGMLGEDDNDRNSSPSSPVTPKNVHFASSLASVKVFHRSARPASVSLPIGSDLETETDDGESSSKDAGYFGWGSWSLPPNTRNRPAPPPSRLSQPSSPSPEPAPAPVPAPTKERQGPVMEIDASRSSMVPSRSSFFEERNIILESLETQAGSKQPFSVDSTNESLVLSGSILVRNISFEKNVVVRFTMDNWATISEVSGTWVAHISSLPTAMYRTPGHNLTLGDLIAHSEQDKKLHQEGWDRFVFKIKLGDYVSSLPSKTLFLVGRFTSAGQGEWWDNNSGSNYVVRFKTSPAPSKASDLPKVPTTAASNPSTSPSPKDVSPLPKVIASTPPTISKGSFAGLKARASSPPPSVPSPLASPMPSPMSEAPPVSSPSSRPSVSPTHMVTPTLAPIVTNHSVISVPSFHQGGLTPIVPAARPNPASSPQAQVTSHRLRGFSLSNWVSPQKSRPASGSFSSAPVTPSKEVAPALDACSPPAQAEDSAADPGADADAVSSSSEDDDSVSKQDEEGEVVTPPTSPLLDTPRDVSPIDSERDDHRSAEATSDPVKSPIGQIDLQLTLPPSAMELKNRSHDPTPPSSGGATPVLAVSTPPFANFTPKKSGSPVVDSPSPKLPAQHLTSSPVQIMTDFHSPASSPPPSIDSSDSLYKMFVKHWCFAQTPQGPDA